MAELTASKDEVAGSKLSEREVVAYLKQHDDFLSRHPDLLEAIELRHRSGSAVSLIEKQVDMLRAKNQRLEDRMARLLEAARENERRTEAVQRLARTLIRAPSLAAVAAGLVKCMREDFGIDAVFVGVASSQFKRHDIVGIVPIEPDGRLARAFEDFFRTRLIECGPIAEDKAALLFGKAVDSIASAAVVPLEKEKSFGMLALGSSDPKRFQPRQGKLFLELTAELVAAAIRARI
ncbi:DUF484 family protein [Sinimarinibacterium sp. CAU 1509]|uniref:DUF484 family protein n=1 Tax=Sinimarinibacterium sp. CAU 1509 TaxID=2562283 RepID=UPI0010AD01F7|nr:DUF484 family protein [Sinimarinibacterium sp. CAU 1509]TJY64805.1 DUF484 family protein [Sinimarinibacterium sp. CAU 1509]